LFGASSALAVPLSDLHKNAAPSVTPNRAGLFFDVSGIVTSPDSVYSKVNTQVFIQDYSGGMSLFQSGGIAAGLHFNLGDSVAVRGQVTQFDGLTELTSLTNLTVISSGNFATDPLVLTCNQLNNTLLNSVPDSFPEYNESRLIRINNVTRVGGAAWPSTCAGANSTIMISDGTATSQLFIDLDSQVCGSPDPSGPFDVIGILSQFKTTSPYSSGYQIVPRFKTDIIPHVPGPVFITGPTAVDVESTTVSIQWTTDSLSTSFVSYGLTTAYGGTAGDSTLTTNHLVALTGLTPGKIYHYQAGSSDPQGTRLSADFTFATPSSTPGQMNFYFNRSIDASLADPDTAQGLVYLANQVINRINSAQHDISMSVYTFDLSTICDALLAAWSRGVKIRFILDAGAGQSQADRLRTAGIPVITGTYGGNHPTGGIHHEKWLCIDARDTTSTTDDWVWTGSINMTSENQADANNGFEIQDYGLAQAYLLEFNQEWGSTTDTPNAANSRMGNRKSDITPHHFVINDIPIDLYFSPSDGTESKIVSALSTANYSIAFCMYDFTSNPISAEMRTLWNNGAGIPERGVFDQSESGTTGSEWPDMSGSGGTPFTPPLDVWLDTEPNLMHDKYGIIDAGHPESDAMVITGSHNWTNAANTVNDENTLIFHDARIANLYLQDFSARYHISGGSADLTPVGIGSMPGARSVSMSAPWPSPSFGLNGGSVTFTIPGSAAPGQRTTLGLYDLSGRLVRTLFNGPAVPGVQRVAIPATDSRGARLGAGVYFLRLSALGTTQNQKWVVVR
jgi:hypothetical protein